MKSEAANPPRECAILCSGVSKCYGKKVALRDVSLTVEEGEVFGFLGPNGAGKTTLIKVLLGLVTPDAGSISVFGRDLFSDRRAIMREMGAVVEAPIFCEYLSAYENLRSLVSLNGPVDTARIRDVLSLVGLAEVAGDTVRTFSYGMKQRLGIAQALLPHNRLVLLDEPTNGLDPHGIAGMRRLIRNLSRNQGATVFVSSHLLHEVEHVCDRVAIIDQGHIALTAHVEDLASAPMKGVEVCIEPTDEARATARRLGGTPMDLKEGDDRTGFIFAGRDIATPELVADLVHAGVRIVSVLPQRFTLEDVFLKHTANGTQHDRSDAF